MSDAPLTQEAIDALLAAAAAAAPTPPPPAEGRSPAYTEPPSAAPPKARPPDLEEAVRDLGVDLVVVFGSTELTIAEVLQLGPGSIVELERDAALPVEIRLADRVVARAEVVTVDDAYALRIVENLVRPKG